MANKIVIRVQSKAGRFVLDGLVTDSPLIHLQQLLEGRTGIQPLSQKVLSGYPPKEISSYSPTVSLRELDLKSGETIIVSELSQLRQTDDIQSTPTQTVLGTHEVVDLTLTEEEEDETVELTSGNNHIQIDDKSRDVDSSGTSPVGSKTTGSSSVSGSTAGEDGADSPSGHQGEREGEGSVMGLCYSSLLPHTQPRLARRIVPADNSCLFRSISYLISNDRDSPSDLRQLAAGVILSHPQRYSAVVLGKTREQYVQWLLREESWGGAIELSVFSEYYHIELDVVDVQSQRIDRFGEDRRYSQRALLIYDGIHYDPLVLEGQGGSVLRKTFPVTDSGVLLSASQLAREAFQAHQYTDVGRFSLRCLACGVALRGQTEAQNHAVVTGHINFGEV